MPARGVAYVAIGDAAVREQDISAASLLRHNPDLDITVYSEPLEPGIAHENGVRQSRRAKLTLFEWCPYDAVFYLDADTRVLGDITAGFDILADGWDLALCTSTSQGSNFLWHLDEAERAECLSAAGTYLHPLVYQAGVFFVARNDRTEALFAAWREEWEKRQRMDQGALVRAMHRSPVKVWLLGEPWNSAHRGPGELVAHYFGKAKA